MFESIVAVFGIIILRSIVSALGIVLLDVVFENSISPWAKVVGGLLSPPILVPSIILVAPFAMLGFVVFIVIDKG